MHQDTEIRRLPGGSIDLHHYTAAGRTLHGRAVRAGFARLFAAPGRLFVALACRCRLRAPVPAYEDSLSRMSSKTL